MEELQQLVETAKLAVPGVDAAIAAAIDRKLNPVGHLPMQAWAALCRAVLAVTYTASLSSHILLAAHPSSTLQPPLCSASTSAEPSYVPRCLAQPCPASLVSLCIALPERGLHRPVASCMCSSCMMSDHFVMLCSLPPSRSPSWVPSASSYMGLYLSQSRPNLRLLSQPSAPGARTRSPGAPGRAQSAPSASAKATPSAGKQPLQAAGWRGRAAPPTKGRLAKPVSPMTSCPTS